MDHNTKRAIMFTLFIIAILPSIASSTIFTEPYNEDSMLSFQVVGPAYAVTSEWEIHVSINLVEIYELGKAAKQKHESMKLHMPCFNCVTNRPTCIKTYNRIGAKIDDAAMKLAWVLQGQKSARKRRAIETLGNIIGALTGNLSQDDKREFDNKLAAIASQQDEVVKQFAESKQLFVKAFDEVKSTTKYVQTLSFAIENATSAMAREARISKEFQYVISEMEAVAEDFAEKVTSIISSITSHQIHANLLPWKEVQGHYELIMKRNASHDFFPIKSFLELAVIQHSSSMTNNKMIFTIKAPTCGRQQWTLLKIKRAPVVRDLHITIIEPVAEFIAETPKGKTTLIKSKEKCVQRISGEFICHFDNLISNGENRNCIGQALETRKVNHEKCKGIVHTALIVKTASFRLASNTLLVIPVGQTTIKTECEGNEQEEPSEMKLDYPTKVTPSRPCKISI